MGRIDQPGRIVGTLGEMTPSSVQVTFAPRVFMLPDTKRWDTFIWCPWLYVFSEFIRAKMHSVLQGTTSSRGTCVGTTALSAAVHTAFK